MNTLTIEDFCNCCAIIVINMRAKWKKKRMRRLKRKRRQAKNFLLLRHCANIFTLRPIVNYVLLVKDFLSFGCRWLKMRDKWKKKRMRRLKRKRRQAKK
ncbi:nucleoprotein [Trichinella spiralis]|uniref:60S ribosomal protein L41 n=1 Tax=Trichinella spiralis TaxID=6334 RepID=A0ABR3K675_TRISP